MSKPAPRGARLPVLTTGPAHGFKVGDVVRLRPAGRPGWWRRVWSLRRRPSVRYAAEVRYSSIKLAERPATGREWLAEFINTLRGYT